VNRWDLATWLAVTVLVLGSVAIFVWFAVDALRLYRRLGERRREGAPPG
jgi:hypothetical protein